MIANLCATVFVLASLTQSARTSSLDPDWSELVLEAQQDWGSLGTNSAVVAPDGRPAAKLRIGDRSYDHGIGSHAQGSIALDLAGRYRRFEAAVGVQWQGGTGTGSVIFQVVKDGREAWRSDVLREGGPAVPVNLDVTGARELRLEMMPTEDGITCDCANWVDVRLTPDPDARARVASGSLNIAPFARVVTSDPSRKEGTKASRVEPMPAEDIYPDTNLEPGADAGYDVPATGVIGLHWNENRRLRSVGLRWAGSPPSRDQVKLEVWSGESPWQGRWEPIDVGPDQGDAGLMVWALPIRFARDGAPRVRWLIDPEARTGRLMELIATTTSRWETVPVRCTISKINPSKDGLVRIDITNGRFEGLGRGPSFRVDWPTSDGPLNLDVWSAIPQRYKADRTVLRFTMPDGAAFGVAVEDLRDGNPVTVAGTGLTVERVLMDGETAPRPPSPEPKIRDMVSSRPDQDFETAFRAVHDPIQDLGPMMLSLACDNRKLVAFREGAVTWDADDSPDIEPRAMPDRCVLTPVFGDQVIASESVDRHLQGGWLPIPTISTTTGPIAWEQAVFVSPVDEAPARGGDSKAPAWRRGRAAGVIEVRATNSGTSAAETSFAWAISGQGAEAATWASSPTAVTLTDRDGRLLAVVDRSESQGLEPRIDGPNVRWVGSIAPGATVKLRAILPLWRATCDEAIGAGNGSLERTEAYWRDQLSTSMQVDVCEPFLSDLVRASQVHCLLAARDEEHGERVAAWISSDRYGPLESEANAVVRGMDLHGHAEFARRSLDFFRARVGADGRLTTGYTLIGAGEFLWTLAEHVDRTNDDAWLRSIAPDVARVAHWIVDQRSRTVRDGEPSSGLFPPGVSADWNRFDFRFFNDAQYQAGLEAAARMLSRINHVDAPALMTAANAYRADVLRAYRLTRALTPVVRLRDQTWVPGSPALFASYGRVEEFLPGQDANRSWAYSVELGAHHLAATGLLDPRSPEVDWALDELEDTQFLRTGMGGYPEDRNRADPFNLGGFAKVQPYYARVAELYAARDEIKPFIRAYFNAIGSLAGRETLSFWEHFHNTGGWNKTHETGWFLAQTRLMLVQERGDELWVAPFVPTSWLGDGEKVRVERAPTRFGLVSYAIDSETNRGLMRASITVNEERGLQRIMLRLRDPDGRTLRSATIDGKPIDETAIDRERSTISISPKPGAIEVIAEFNRGA
jgi:hypothetical protein